MADPLGPFVVDAVVPSAELFGHPRTAIGRVQVGVDVVDVVDQAVSISQLYRAVFIVFPRSPIRWRQYIIGIIYYMVAKYLQYDPKKATMLPSATLRGHHWDR